MRRQYLEPLKKKDFFPGEEADCLLSSTTAILRFQRSFMEELEEAADSGDIHSPSSYTSPSHLRVTRNK